jgi:hypothetical protein
MALEIFVPGRHCFEGGYIGCAGKFRTKNTNIGPSASIKTGIE